MRSQWLKKVRQTVVINFMHQGQQATYFALRKAFSRKPRQIVSGQVRQHLALVLAKGHGHGDQFLQVFGVHLAAFMRTRPWRRPWQVL